MSNHADLKRISFDDKEKHQYTKLSFCQCGVFCLIVLLFFCDIS